MLIRFAKHRDDTISFTCVRADGSTSEIPTGPYVVEHDLIRYAVETTLGYGDAFYGRLAHGQPREALGQHEVGGAAGRSGANAAQAEQVVKLVQLARRGAIDPADFAEALTLLAAGDEHPALSPFEFESILVSVVQLVHTWKQLPAGEALELVFSSSG